MVLCLEVKDIGGLPFTNLENIVCMNYLGCSPALMWPPPTLVEGDYREKLTQIFLKNAIKSVAHMEVPCCCGKENAMINGVKSALEHGNKAIPCEVVIFSVEGKILQIR